MISHGQLKTLGAGLQRRMVQDATLGLAMAAAWLDPLEYVDDTDEYMDATYEDSEDPNVLTRFALNCARACSPRLYAELAQWIRADWDFHQVQDAFIEGIKREWPYIPVECLLDVAMYGLPLQFVGVGRSDGDFEGRHPHLAGFLSAYFTESREPISEDGEDEAGEPDFEMIIQDNDVLARALIASLIAKDRQPYADLALLLMRIWSKTGNSMIDYSDEEWYDSGYEPMPCERWALDEVDGGYSQTLIVLDAADRALKVLDTDDEIAGAFIRNIAAVRAAIEGKNEHVTITWPDRARTRCAAKSYQRATGADAGLLLVRDCFAEGDG